jgi:multicomponent Na+:H+ antiporter subunit E
MKVLNSVYYIFYLLAYYLSKLVAANLYIAWDILTPRMRTNPGLIEVDIDHEKDLGLLLLSNLVSMTPGTLSIDIDSAKEKLKVHVLYMDRKEEILNEIERMKGFIHKITG